MRTIANLLWVVLVGAWSAVYWLIIAAVLAITVVGLPFARQCLKLANLSFWPFGRTVVRSPTATPLGGLGAVLWFIPGAFLALGYAISGAVLFLTIIGAPFGIQALKLAGLSLAPFGKEVRSISSLNRDLSLAAQARSSDGIDGFLSANGDG